MRRAQYPKRASINCVTAALLSRARRAVCALMSQLFRLVANRLDVIAIGIKDKRAKITGMVLRPRS
jgi:hypothetical protein